MHYRMPQILQQQVSCNTVCDSRHVLDNLLKLATFFFHIVPIRILEPHFWQQKFFFLRAVCEIYFCEIYFCEMDYVFCLNPLILYIYFHCDLKDLTGIRRGLQAFNVFQLEWSPRRGEHAPESIAGNLLGCPGDPPQSCPFILFTSLIYKILSLQMPV